MAVLIMKSILNLYTQLRFSEIFSEILSLDHLIFLYHSSASSYGALGKQKETYMVSALVMYE